MQIKTQLEEQLQINYYVTRNLKFKIASNPKYEGYQRGRASLACMFVDTESATCANTASVKGIKSKVSPSNQTLPDELKKNKKCLENFKIVKYFLLSG